MPAVLQEHRDRSPRQEGRKRGNLLRLLRETSGFRGQKEETRSTQTRSLPVDLPDRKLSGELPIRLTSQRQKQSGQRETTPRRVERDRKEDRLLEKNVTRAKYYRAFSGRRTRAISPIRTASPTTRRPESTTARRKTEAGALIHPLSALHERAHGKNASPFRTNWSPNALRKLRAKMDARQETRYRQLRLSGDPGRGLDDPDDYYAARFARPAQT